MGVTAEPTGRKWGRITTTQFRKQVFGTDPSNAH